MNKILRLTFVALLAMVSNMGFAQVGFYFQCCLEITNEIC